MIDVWLGIVASIAAWCIGLIVGRLTADRPSCRPDCHGDGFAQSFPHIAAERDCETCPWQEGCWK